jgi:subtilase family serine protease
MRNEGSALSPHAKFVWISAVLLIATSFVPIPTSAQMLQTITGNHPAAIPPEWLVAPDGRQVDLIAVPALRNASQLARLESDLKNRHSPRYHQWLTIKQFVAQFGPTKEQMAEVGGWLAQQGFTVTASDQRTRRVYFTGTVATIRQALGTSLVSDGTNYVNTSDPVVPAELASTIQAILGLSGLPHLPASDSRNSATRRRSIGSRSRLFSDAVVSGIGPGYAESDLTSLATGGPLILQSDEDRAPVRIAEPQTYLDASADAAAAARIASQERILSGRGHQSTYPGSNRSL